MNTKAKYIGFIGLIISAFLGVLDSTIVNIALPKITDYFKASLNDTSWITTIYALALAVFMITASKLADQFGRKKLMLIGLSIFGVSSVLCGFSNSLLFLIIMRFLQGLGGAIITPLVIPMGLEIFDKDKMQVVVGAAGAVVGLAAAGGPPLGGILIKYVNWQAVFFVNIPLTVIALILVFCFINESYDDTSSKKIDWFGMITLTISLFSLTFALLKGKDYGWNSALILSLFIAFAVPLVLFIIIESKLTQPMVELRLFKEITFTTSSICYLITGFGIMCPLLIFNYFLQNVLEYDTLKAALIMMSVSITTMFATPIGSVLARKIGTRIINFVGILVLGLGILRLSHLSVDTTKIEMIIDLVICGIGLGFSIQALTSAVKFIPKEKSGMGSGIVNAARQIGSCIGIAILVSIFNGNVTSAKDDIKHDVISYVNNRKEIIKPVRVELIKFINDKFKSENNNSSSSMASQSSIQKSVEAIIKNNQNLFSKNAEFYNNDTLKKLYDGTSSLRDGIDKVSDAQGSLNSGIGNLDKGLGTLYDGSEAFGSGLNTFNDGVSRLTSGTKELADKSEGLTTLVNGINSLNTGSQMIMNQFSQSQNKNTPTLYDGVSGVSMGAQQLASGINNYTSAVDNALYMIITSNPNSRDLLNFYNQSLKKLQAQYVNAPESAKNQYTQQIGALSSMVNVYSAALDKSVTNESEFESKLNASGANIVSAGNTLREGAGSLAGGASKVEGQFENGGAFKEGMSKIAQGIGTLSNNSSNILKLQSGISSVNTAVSKLNDGSSKLNDSFSKIAEGVNSAKSGADKLLDGSNKITDASKKVEGGSSTLTSSIGMAGQKSAITSVIDKLKSEKNNKISAAFNETFFIAAVVIIICSILGLFTDKKVSVKND